ncbi:phytanoyl-CoA dioxygenase family protein [Streptomyces daliensis]
MVHDTVLRTLDEAQAAAFVRDGYVISREVFPREVAEQFLPHIWRRLDGVTPDPATWRRPNEQVEDVLTDGPVDGLFTARYRACVDDLVGAGRWTTKRGYGWVICRFPGFSSPPWQPPPTGWHVDGMDFQHRLTSPEQGLVGLELFTDIEPGGGGTAVRVGSHAVVSRLLRDAEPDGVSYPWLREWCAEFEGLPVRELTGAAGDVIWMHPHLVHARSPNTRETVRIAANRTISLHAPMDVTGRADESLVERAIRTALAEG